MKRVSLFLEEWQIEGLKKLAEVKGLWAGAARFAIHALLFEYRDYLAYYYKIEIPKLPQWAKDGRARRKIPRATRNEAPPRSRMHVSGKRRAKPRG